MNISSGIEKQYQEVPAPDCCATSLFSLRQMAEGTSDELARQDGRQVRLEEDRDLQLPFLLPEDGYSCDIVRGIPNGQSRYSSHIVRGISNIRRRGIRCDWPNVLRMCG